MKSPRLLSMTLAATTLITAQGYAHDAWLAAKWNKDKTQILISALVAEHFPQGEPIKGLQRFLDPRAYVIGGNSIALAGDPSDSTLLGSLSPATSVVVATGVKQREIKFKRDLAERYLIEEVGLTKQEAAAFLTPGVQEFDETYSRFLKTVIALGHEGAAPKDSVLGLPLELVLVSWKKEVGDRAMLHFRLLDNGKPAANAPVRVLVNGKTTVVRTDTQGEAHTSVEMGHPILLARIQVTKLGENRLHGLWTNLAIYRLEKQ